MLGLPLLVFVLRSVSEFCAPGEMATAVYRPVLKRGVFKRASDVIMMNDPKGFPELFSAEALSF